MTHPEHDALPRDRHLDRALDHAQRLTDSRPRPELTPAWSGQAAHVGDLTVLALALSRRR